MLLVRQKYLLLVMQKQVCCRANKGLFLLIFPSQPNLVFLYLRSLSANSSSNLSEPSLTQPVTCAYPEPWDRMFAVMLLVCLLQSSHLIDWTKRSNQRTTDFCQHGPAVPAKSNVEDTGFGSGSGLESISWSPLISICNSCCFVLLVPSVVNKLTDSVPPC